MKSATLEPGTEAEDAVEGVTAVVKYDDIVGNDDAAQDTETTDDPETDPVDTVDAEPVMSGDPEEMDADLYDAAAMIVEKITALDEKRAKLVGAYERLTGVSHAVGAHANGGAKRRPRTAKSGVVDGRTAAGRALHAFIPVNEIDFENLPVVSGGKIDKRSRVGRAIAAAGGLDAQGYMRNGFNAAAYEAAVKTPSVADSVASVTPASSEAIKPVGFVKAATPTSTKAHSFK
jgi:hypothetical protein